MSKRILISTSPQDTDSIIVGLRLREIGHTVLRWFPSELGATTRMSYNISNASGFRSKLIDDRDAFDLTSFDVLWNRR